MHPHLPLNGIHIVEEFVHVHTVHNVEPKGGGGDLIFNQLNKLYHFNLFFFKAKGGKM